MIAVIPIATWNCVYTGRCEKDILTKFVSLHVDASLSLAWDYGTFAILETLKEFLKLLCTDKVCL